MRGLYKKTREETFDRDGFYPTGDRCRIDRDGYLYFEGRAGEMVKTSGANVAPREVEMVLESWPEVKEAVVFGVPDSQRSEIVVAVVVPRGGGIDRPALDRFLRDQLSHFKLPQFLIPMAQDDIPRAATGKVQKHLLRDIVISNSDKFKIGAR
jgi:acyl-CoA synthetase (AMP-forming)/AMP-acid ligase II